MKTIGLIGIMQDPGMRHGWRVKAIPALFVQNYWRDLPEILLAVRQLLRYTMA